MKVKKVTREMLRDIPPGKTIIFELPNASACDTAKTLAYQLQNIDGVKFQAETRYDLCIVKIKRL